MYEQRYAGHPPRGGAGPRSSGCRIKIPFDDKFRAEAGKVIGVEICQHFLREDMGLNTLCIDVEFRVHLILK